MIELDRNSANGILYTGLDFRAQITLRDNATPRDLSSSTVTARILSKDHETAYTDEASVASNTTGSNFQTGIVVVRIAAAQTAKVSESEAVLAVYETDSDGGKWGYFFPLRTKKGLPNG